MIENIAAHIIGELTITSLKTIYKEYCNSNEWIKFAICFLCLFLFCLLSNGATIFFYINQNNIWKICCSLAFISFLAICYIVFVISRLFYSIFNFIKNDLAYIHNNMSNNNI